jgi:hypothetical protein
MIFKKLRSGEQLEEIEIDVLEKLLLELEHAYSEEWKLAERALQEMAYYKRLAKIRKYK